MTLTHGDISMVTIGLCVGGYRTTMSAMLATIYIHTYLHGRLNQRPTEGHAYSELQYYTPPPSYPHTFRVPQRMITKNNSMVVLKFKAPHIIPFFSNSRTVGGHIEILSYLSEQIKALAATLVARYSHNRCATTVLL